MNALSLNLQWVIPQNSIARVMANAGDGVSQVFTVLRRALGCEKLFECR